MHGTLDHFQWNEATVAKLRHCVEKKFSASQAAIELQTEFGGRVTRNTCIGKAHRLGISFQSETVRNNYWRDKVKPAPSSPPWLFRKKFAPVREPEPEPDALNIPFKSLNASTCRWPVGEYPYAYCGHEPVEGKPYCQHHCGKAYVPPQERHRAPRPR
jgi:GcrA cell cycle regulator